MEPDVLERAFDRFFSQAASRGDRFGLGLAIAKELIESIGGGVELASTAGEGTVATIRLPLARLVAE
jgi:signal transduction histidine kinase